MRYIIKVEAVYTVEVEANSEEEAFEAAGNIYWQEDPDSCEMGVEKVENLRAAFS